MYGVWLVFKMKIWHEYDTLRRYIIQMLISINKRTPQIKKQGDGETEREKSPRVFKFIHIYQNTLYTYLRFDHNQIDFMCILLMRFNLFCYVLL